MLPFLFCFLLLVPVSYKTAVPKNRDTLLVMQPFNCVSFLLGVAILSATLGPFVTIAHRELLMVTNSETGLENKLELTSDKTNIDEEIRNNVLTGRKMAFGDAVMEKTDAKDAKSKPSSGDIKNHSTNSCAPSSLKIHTSIFAAMSIRVLLPQQYIDMHMLEEKNPSVRTTSSSRMKTGPSMDSIKLEGSILELVWNVPNLQHIRILPSKRNPSSGFKRELKDLIVHSTSYKTNDDWKDKMLEASDEVLKLLNRDYSHVSPKPPVRN